MSVEVWSPSMGYADHKATEYRFYAANAAALGEATAKAIAHWKRMRSCMTRPTYCNVKIIVIKHEEINAKKVIYDVIVDSNYDYDRKTFFLELILLKYADSL